GQEEAHAPARVRRAEAPREPSALRLPHRARGRDALVGGGQGPVARPERAAARDDDRAAPDGLQRLRGRDPRGRVRRRHRDDLGPRHVGAREPRREQGPRQGRPQDAPARQEDEGLVGARADARPPVAADQASRPARFRHARPDAREAEVRRLAPLHGRHRPRGRRQRAPAGAGRRRRSAALDREARVSVPTGVKPMLATLVDAPFHDAGWVDEYETGKRSPAWRKVKVRAEEEFVIGGYTAPEGARTHFGALLIGAFDDGRLRYAGKVGTGFTGKTLADLAQRFARLRRATSPFADAPRMRDATWLEPTLVAQIGFM